ncbi:MAG: hypothetical protein AB1331_04380 [Bacillota bacterium]
MRPAAEITLEQRRAVSLARQHLAKTWTLRGTLHVQPVGGFNRFHADIGHSDSPRAAGWGTGAPGGGCRQP